MKREDLILLKSVISAKREVHSKSDNNISATLTEFVIDSRIESIFLEKLYLENSLNTDNQKRLESNSKKRLIKTLEIINKTIPLLNKLNENNINYVVLKGFYLTNFIYRSRSHRPINDIDILVSSEDLDKACHVIEESNIFPKNLDKSPKIKEKFNNIYSDHLAPRYTNDGIVRLEVHHRIFKNLDSNINSMLFSAKEFESFGNINVPILSTEHNLLHIIFHGTSKGNFDVGIQYLFDVIELASTKDVDYLKLEIDAKRIGLEKELFLTKLLLKNLFSYDLKLQGKFKIAKEYIDSAERILTTKYFQESFARLFYRNNFNKNMASIYQVKKSYEFLKPSIIMQILTDVFKTKTLRNIFSVIMSSEKRQILEMKKNINNYFND